MYSRSYKAAGVDLDAASQAKELFKPHVRATFGPEVLGDIGLFAGLFELKKYRNPVLVASTDGVGTKLKLAHWMNRFDTLGYDIVNHCINDVLTTGARPLFFLDYVAVETLIPKQVEMLIEGISKACTQASCALLGGETAQLPGIYNPGTFDLAGFLVGAVERDAILDPRSVTSEDLLLALPSSGPHTNGYSMINSVFNLDHDSSMLHVFQPELEATLGDTLLKPHRPYWPLLEPVLPFIKTMAHITGGGLDENLARVMPKGLAGHIDRNSWQVPAIFRLIQKRGELSSEEMNRIFNMGVGMVLVCAPNELTKVQRFLPEAWLIGKVVPSMRD
jgi:phosphoribosylformylglycinamidine cyclo-ligase